MENWLDVLSLFFIGLCLFDWAAFLLLWGASRRAKEIYKRSIRTLDERKTAAFFIACGATVFAGLGVNRLIHGALPPEVGLPLLLTGMALASVANINWLRRALRGHFRPGDKNDQENTEEGDMTSAYADANGKGRDATDG